MGKGVDVPPRAILVDKPAGPTSHDVVATCRRALGRPRTGHTGTLDPFATGLLVVLVGRATRIAPFVSGLDKTYVAGIRLGQRSESGDPEGPITPGGPLPDEAALRDALAAMVGEIDQRVPALSARASTLVRSVTPSLPAAAAAAASSSSSSRSETSDSTLSFSDE